MPLSSSDSPTVLITDPAQRAALAATRALGRRGFRVVCVGESPALAGRSRWCRQFERISSSSMTNGPEYVELVAASARRVCADVVLPVSDVASRALLGQGSKLGVPVAGPSFAAYVRASDKAGLLETAAKCGVRVPRQVRLDHPMDVDQAIGAVVAPVVVKPSISVVDIGGVAAKTAVRIVGDVAELRSVLASYEPEAYPLLLQERTVGDGVGVFLLRVHGQTLMQLGHRRLREKPPSGGVSTYREAIAPPARLLAQCEALLDLLNYDGAAMIEFKHDEQRNEYVLMEINARLWGSLQLAIDAGVDFASGLVDWTLGRIVRPAAAVIGTRTFWELGELDHAIALATKSRRELQVPDGFAVGWRASLRSLGDHRKADHSEVLHWNDPLPFTAELWRWIRGND